MKLGKPFLFFIILGGILLLLAVCMPQKSIYAQTNVPTLTTIASVTPFATLQPTPIIDATQVNLEILQQEKIKLERENSWWWGNGLALLSTIVVIGIAYREFHQWRTDHRISQAKREEDYRIEQAKLDEERFQKVVEGLGSDRVEARVGAAIMLLTFLRSGYEKFYSQTFLLAVAHLRLRKADPNTPEPLDALSQALIIVFREAYSKARNNIENFTPENLDAASIHMDYAYLSKIDLKEIRVRNAFFRKAVLWKAQLQKSYFKYSDLSGANIGRANLSGADFSFTILKDAYLSRADFEDTDLTEVNLDGADLRDTNLEKAKKLQGAKLCNVKGLSTEQLALCAAKGAIIDDVQPATS